MILFFQKILHVFGMVVNSKINLKIHLNLFHALLLHRNLSFDLNNKEYQIFEYERKYQSRE